MNSTTYSVAPITDYSERGMSSPYISVQDCQQASCRQMECNMKINYLENIDPELLGFDPCSLFQSITY